MSKNTKLHGLYVITDDKLTPVHTFLSQVKEALEGGAKIVQLRDKESDFHELALKAVQLQELCNEYDALFVLNDKVELAIELGLGGLHIGKTDHHRVKEIREQFDGVIGVSCYGDVNLAKEMQEAGVDYVAFGSFYSSPTKPNSNIVAADIIQDAKEALDIPVCVIGGINSTNYNELEKYSPDMVAVINDIWTSENIKEKSNFYKSKFTN